MCRFRSVVQSFFLLAFIFALDISGTQAIQIVSEWLSAKDGNWSDASRWSTPNFPDIGSPNSGDAYDVIIGAEGDPFTISLNENVEINTLVLESIDVELDIDHAALLVTDGLTLDGSIISLSSTDSLSTSADLIFSSTDNSEKHIEGNGLVRFLEGRDNNIIGPSQGALTIDSGITIESLSRQGKIRSFAGPLTNLGTLRSTTEGTLEIRGESFINKASIEIAGRTDIRSSSWSNEGTLLIRPGGRLFLFGNFGAADIGTIVDEGAQEVVLAGVLENSGQVLNLDDLGLTVPLSINSGEIRGGIIASSGSGSLGFYGGINATLNGVTLQADVELEGVSGTPRVFVRNGLTLDGSTLTMPEGADLLFTGNEPQTLGGTGTIFAPNRPLTSAITTIAGDKLTIGENIVIRNGTEAFRELEIDFKENRGTIISEAPDSLVTIGDNISLATDPTWTNNGTIIALDGILRFTGNYSVNELGDLRNPSGTVILDGNISNQGKAIVLPSNTGQWQIDGRVKGGVIEARQGVKVALGGLFESVTLKGQAESNRGSRGGGSFVIKDQLTLDDAHLVINSGDGFNSEDSNPVFINGVGVIQLDGLRNNTTLGFAEELTIANGVTVETSVSGSGTIYADTIINQGAITAQSNGSALFIDGNLTNSGTLATRSSAMQIDGLLNLTVDSKLEMELSKDYITTLSVTGPAFLDGQLLLAVDDPATLSVGDEFIIINSALPDGLLGRFADVINGIVSRDISFQVDYASQAVTLTVTKVPEPCSECTLLLAVIFNTLSRVKRNSRLSTSLI